MNKKICLVFIFSIFLFKLGSAGIGDWTTYTNKNDVQKVMLKDGKLWCATTGGMVVLNTQDESLTKLTNVDGLGGNYLYSAALDSSGNLWLGAQNGTISKYDLKENHWEVYYNFITDERTFSIREIVVDGEKLWVGSDVGVSVFYSNKPPHGEITETYRRLGDLNADVDVNKIHLVGDKIWVGTEKGVAFAPKDSRFLLDPRNWTSFVKESSPGLVDDYVYAITDVENEILIGTKKGVFKFHSVDSSWASFGLENRIVKDLKYMNGKLMACTDFGIYINEGGIWSGLSYTGLLDTNFNSVAIDRSSSLWVGTASKGISVYNGDQWKNFVIDGPPGNVFLDMDVDAEEKLWCANDVAGASYFDGSQWVSLDSVPEIHGNAMVAVEKDKEDNIWFSSWGGGVMKMERKDTTWHAYNEKNSPFKGYPGHPTYIVVNDVAVDEMGNRWFPNWDAWDNSTRVLCAPVYKDTFLVYYDGDRITSKLMLKAKAIGGHLYICFNNGLLDYNYNWTVEDKTDDRVTRYTQTDHHLSADNVMTVDVDKNGTLWVGTSAGMDTFDAEWGRFRTVILPDPLGPQVNTMMVDERNNKWIGTPDGLGVINSQGEFVHVFTTLNSKICDNNVKGIKIDKNTGDVWIGTANGLSRYESGIAPAKNLTEVIPYPNPFIIIEGTEKLTFDRLPYLAKIKIYTVAGELVREIDSGDQWDGKNKAGELVSGGIYLFYISDTSGKKIVGKIAVIRE
jgi:ligand-binding sensor domain-containing protein